MKSKTKRKLLVFTYTFVLASSLNAALRVWDGGGLDGFFSTRANWDGDPLVTPIPVSNTDTLGVGANTAGGVPFIGLDTGEFKTPSFTFLAAAATPYTVTANSVSDFLTLTGGGVALQNSSPVRQNFSLITTTVGAATQTWQGGAQGLVMAQVDLGTNHVLTIDGTGTTATTRNEIRGGITGNASGLTKAGTGTLLLDNPGTESDYTGATTLMEGRLQLGSDNQISDASKLVLNGGIFDTGGFSDTLSSLILGGSATIDFGISNVSSLIFGNSSAETWLAGSTLNILNFTVGGDSLRFGTDASGLTAAQLAQISFNGMPAGISSMGFLQPVPEPGVSALLLSGLGAFGFFRRRVHRRARA